MRKNPYRRARRFGSESFTAAQFSPLSAIVNVRRNSMAVVFTKVEQKDQVVLEKWLAETRETHE
jgi:hypothetical protein